ncbi:MAG: ABC transporter permease [Kiritimatiellia bacterium]|jgi:peptide/nickel transport system permease protein|nr:ABC transporter permease [Kiritimatiellia bacterium]
MAKEQSILRRLWRRWDTRLCLLVVALYACAAVYGEAVYQVSRWADRTPSYNQVNEASRYVPPAFVRVFAAESGAAAQQPLFPLGSDNLGRDVLQRLIQGARIAFHVGIITSLIAIPLGVILGCLGGYFGGRADSLVVWLCATVASMPGLLFILAIAMVVGQGLLGVYLGIGLTTWVSVCRNVRGEVIKHRGRAYVQAAQVLGYSHARIMFRHILPNVTHIILIAFSIRFPASVATEVFISFLGIGVQGEPSWGIMINNARLRLWQGVWWEMTFVTLAIFALVLAFNHLADALRDLLDPALRTEQV